MTEDWLEVNQLLPSTNIQKTALVVSDSFGHCFSWSSVTSFTLRLGWRTIVCSFLKENEVNVF